MKKILAALFVLFAGSLFAANSGIFNPQNVLVFPSDSGGLSVAKRISTADTNATVVKASAGQLYGFNITNVNAAVRYIKFYDKASAPTCNSDSVVAAFALPGATTGTVSVQSMEMGVSFTNGIAYCLVTGAADNSNTGVSASETIVNIFYK